MSVELFVGLDVGTTAVKAVAFDGAGRPVASGQAGTPWTITPAGAEVAARDLLSSAGRALAELSAACPAGPMVALGVTGIAESGVLVDRSGEPVAPVIAWHDTRDDTEIAELRQAFGDGDEFSAVTGLPLRQQWSITKHRWLQRHSPHSRTAVRRFNVAEWLVRALGGEEATEQSLASRTGWLDMRRRQWWPEALAWSHTAESLMPPIVTAGTPLGTVSSEAGLGRLTGATLTVAGHDHQVAAIGAGAAGRGDELDSCGTAEALVRSVAPGLTAAQVIELTGRGITVGWHAAAEHWCLLGGTQGGLALGRILHMLGHPRAELDRAALAEPSAPVRVTAPAFALATISDIGDDVTPGQVWRAAIETVTDQVADLHDAMTAATGPHARFVVTGGWSTSPALMEVKRQRFGAVTRAAVEQPGALGAAMLAAKAAGTVLDS
ncbi:FGGY-family carbohydrate kinase [Mycobacterium sp. WMMD1722]|uniref:FGGY-family carbohydrate kinase n=1 Tax=Mycobacterium sp. WMMD1722 TaxID=3404117 RepID=UPI003BF4CE18